MGKHFSKNSELQNFRNFGNLSLPLFEFLKFWIPVFWSKWNSYPSFCNNSAGKINGRRFLVFDFSSFHNIIKKSGILNFKNSKSGRLRFPKFRNSWVSDFVEKYFPHFFQGRSLIFLDLIQVILSNQMKKYGLPEPKTLMMHEMLSFRCLMPWNRHFISSIWRRKIQLRR